MVIWAERDPVSTSPLSEAEERLEKDHPAGKVNWMLRRGRNLIIFPSLMINDFAATQIRTFRPLSADETEVTRLLKNWDGNMSAELAEPVLYAAFSAALREQLIDDELGGNADRYRGVPVRVLANMVSGNTAWCDDVATVHREPCDAIVRTALTRALGTIGDSQGHDRDAWRWGDSHIASFAHPLLRFAGPLSVLLGPKVATGGGDHTINRGTYRSMGDGRFPHVHGPGLRALFDMAAPGDARYMIAPGQSGKMTSPHFSDLAAPWAAGSYIVLKGDPDTLRQTATAELTLVP